MNEFLRNFIMTAIRDMIARDVALYQTYQYASGWFAKDVLLQKDLEEIARLYEAKATVDEVIEETENSAEENDSAENTAEEVQAIENTEEITEEEV